MEVKVLDLKKGKLKLTIAVSPKEMAGYFKGSYEKIAPTIKIDGFRPGKAPRKLIEDAAGVARILSEGLDLAVSENYFLALQKEKIIPIKQPKIVINKYPSYGQTEAEIKDDFEFEAEVEIVPEAKLGDYKKLKKIKKGAPEKAKSDDVEKVLNHFQKQAAILTEVLRPAKKGDHVDINFEGFLKHVKIDQMCSKNHPLILGENTLIPGFEDEIVGMKKGEKKEFQIKFPADYHSKEFAGKEATFQVELNNLKEIKLPELDQKFAEKFGHKNVDELKKAVEKNLNEELAQNFRRDLETKVLELVLPLLSAEIPDSMIEKETDRLISDFSAQLVSQGIGFDRYLEMVKKTRDDIRKEIAPQAEKNVKVGILLGKIVEEKAWKQNDPEVGKKAIEYLIETLTD